MEKTEGTNKRSVTASREESSPDSDNVIAKYEEMFAARYTADDPVYRRYINKGMDPPPIVENYFVRRQRSNWNDNRRDSRQYSDRGQKRSYGDDRHHDNEKRQRGHDDDWGYQRGQGRGRGYQGGRGGENPWGHPPRQGWGARDQRGHPPDRRGRRFDDEWGRSSGSYEARHGLPHQPLDQEWT